MADKGTALMGIGASTGENRTAETTKKAIISVIRSVYYLMIAEQILLNIKDWRRLNIIQAQDAKVIVAAASSSSKYHLWYYNC